MIGGTTPRLAASARNAANWGRESGGAQDRAALFPSCNRPPNGLCLAPSTFGRTTGPLRFAAFGQAGRTFRLPSKRSTNPERAHGCGRSNVHTDSERTSHGDGNGEVV